MAEIDENQVKRGRVVLEGWKARLKRMAVPERAPGVDLQRAGLAGLSLFEEVEAAGMIARLERLPAEIFNVSCIADVRDAAPALLAAVRDLAGWTPPPVAVPADLVLRGTWLQAEMTTVIGFALAAHEDAVQRNTLIRKGRGYWDLYDDLAKLGELYADYDAELAAGGGQRYRPEHADEAAELAEKLRKALSGNAVPADSPPALAYQVFDILEGAVEELLDGLWMLERRERRERRPSLRAMSRRAPRKKPPEAPAPA